MGSPTRKNAKNVGIGVALLALSGALLAVDIGTTRAADLEPHLDALAEAIPLATPTAVAAPRRPLERTTVAALIVRKEDRRRDDTPRPPRLPKAIGASSVTHEPPRRVAVAPKASAQIAAGRAISLAKPVRRELTATSPRIRVVARVASTPAPIATGRPSPAATDANARKPALRSAVEAAQFFAVRTVEAQTRGLEHVAAVTHKRGPSRLVVYIIAKTHTGTLVEYEVLRRNGIGFAIESRTMRFVASATPTSLARNDRGR